MSISLNSAESIFRAIPPEQRVDCVDFVAYGIL